MQLLAPLIGKKVTVHSLMGESERQDIGILEAAEGQLVRLKKQDGDTLIYSIYRIRLIKPFDSH